LPHSAGETNPLHTRAQLTLENTRERLEAEARRCRALAESAHPDFKQKYFELAQSIEAYLQASLPGGEQAE